LAVLQAVGRETGGWTLVIRVVWADRVIDLLFAMQRGAEAQSTPRRTKRFELAMHAEASAKSEISARFFVEAMSFGSDSLVQK